MIRKLRIFYIVNLRLDIALYFFVHGLTKYELVLAKPWICLMSRTTPKRNKALVENQQS